MYRTDSTFGVVGPALALLTILLVAACGAAGPAGESAWRVGADTAGGVLRVVNQPPHAEPAPTLEAEEEWRLGTVEGEGPTSFGLIRSVAVLPDGRFAVADDQAEEVRLFDPAGQYLRTFGGKGAGPGELQGMQGVHVDHEGLLRVAEQRNARLSVFHPESGFVRSYPLRLYSYSFRGPWSAVMDAAGRTTVVSSGRYGAGRPWHMLRVYDAAMSQLDSIPYEQYTVDLDRDQPGAWRIDLGNGGFTWAPVPFYSQTHRVLAPTGEFWSSAEGTARLEVARWTPAGDTALVLVSERRPDPVMPAERDSAMTALREGLAERVPTPPRLDASRVPATKPPLYGLALDDRGRLWVRITEPAADSTVYDIFGRDGGFAETVRLPFRVDRHVPPVVRGDTIWVVVTDEVDVQYVVRARLRPIVGRGGR
jgi:hypothetical protein